MSAFAGEGRAPLPAGTMPSLAQVPRRVALERTLVLIPMPSEGSTVRDGFAVAARGGALRVGAGAKVELKRCCDTGTGRGAGRELCRDARIARCMLTSWLIFLAFGWCALQLRALSSSLQRQI